MKNLENRRRGAKARGEILRKILKMAIGLIVIVIVVAVLAYTFISGNIPGGSPSISAEEWNSRINYVNSQVSYASSPPKTVAFLFLLEPQILLKNDGTATYPSSEIEFEIDGPVTGKEVIVNSGDIRPHQNVTLLAQYFTDWLPTSEPFPTFNVTVTIPDQTDKNMILNIHLTPPSYYNSTWMP